MSRTTAHSAPSSAQAIAYFTACGAKEEAYLAHAVAYATFTADRASLTPGQRRKRVARLKDLLDLHETLFWDMCHARDAWEEGSDAAACHAHRNEQSQRLSEMLDVDDEVGEDGRRIVRISMAEALAAGDLSALCDLVAEDIDRRHKPTRAGRTKAHRN